MTIKLKYNLQKVMKKQEVREYQNNDNIIVFNSQQNSVLSNMHYCNITYNNITFHSTEQLFQWLKFTQSPHIQQLILKCKNSKLCKKIANENERNVDNDYLNKRNNNMLLCLSLKFEQCNEFRQLIIQSEHKILVEYSFWLNSNDKAYWGTVYDLNKDCYVGVNACGRLMMQVRNNYFAPIRKERNKQLIKQIKEE